nr:hypothetical protein [Candidatus Sigynarchaeota archaeon]
MKRFATRKAKAFFFAKLSLLGFVAIFWTAFFTDIGVMVNNEPVSLWVHAPTVIARDEPFNVTVESWDCYERLAGGYKGQVSFSIESYNSSTLSTMPLASWTIAGNLTRFTSNFQGAGVVPAYMVSGADNGRRSFQTTISTPGLHYIIVTDVEKNETYRSNPILVVPENASVPRVYWGDIHFHSILSDGSGNPEELYAYARDVALIDFAALTDHAEMFPRFGEYDLFDVFKNYIATTNNYNRDGVFATLVALEWTPLIQQVRANLCWQHMNVYFRGDDMPFFSTFDHLTPDAVYSYLQQQGAGPFIAWTHHVTRGDYPSDFGFYNENINTMVEIYSCHGSGEFQDGLNLYPMVHGISASNPGYSVNDALKMGRKVGIMSSSDGHDGHPGHDLLHTNARALNQYPYTYSAYRYGVTLPGGLTGLLAPNLTRASTFDALQSRSAYATTWVNRHYLEFKVNNITVGVNDSTVQVPSITTARTVELFVAADGVSIEPDMTTTIANVTIFKNSVPWRSITPNNATMRWNIIDTAPVTGTSYEHCIQKADGRWYINQRSKVPVDPASLNTNGVDYYYARVVDSLGGAAWIGPIWVEVA